MRETERQMEEGRTDSEMATLSSLSSLQDDGPKDSKMSVSDELNRSRRSSLCHFVVSRLKKFREKNVERRRPAARSAKLRKVLQGELKVIVAAAAI